MIEIYAYKENVMLRIPQKQRSVRQIAVWVNHREAILGIFTDVHLLREEELLSGVSQQQKNQEAHMDTQTTSYERHQLSNLINALGDGDGLARQRARLQLEHIGQESIPALLEALENPNTHVRWEAVRVLGEIRDPKTAAKLVKMLMDEDTGVRWGAMESLSRMGRKCLHPLLESFIKNFDSLWLREGVHHILRVLKDRHELNDRENILFDELDKQAVPGFESGWTSQQAWAAEKALEVLDRQAMLSR
jgi:HEAT repeat protein